MTFREKWLKDHPDDAEHMFLDTCPHKEGYEAHSCNRCYEMGFTCRDCWNREMPEKAPDECVFANVCKHVKPTPDLNALIERAATKKDISLTILITGDSTHISVYPCPDPSEKTGNPVAEAYKILVASGYRLNGVSEAIRKLEEALE